MLWNSKLLVIKFMTVALVIGFGYAQVVQPKYNISVPYRVAVFSILSHQTCETKNMIRKYQQGPDCLSEGTLRIFMESIGSDWVLNNAQKAITFTTSSLLPFNDYEAILSKASKTTNEALKAQAKLELELLESPLNGNLFATERVATNLLNAKRMIKSLDAGKSAITFGPVKVIKSPDIPKVMGFSVVLGGIIAAFFVFVWDAVKKRKEQ